MYQRIRTAIKEVVQLLFQKYNITIQIQHISGELNYLSDRISRPLQNLIFQPLTNEQLHLSDRSQDETDITNATLMAVILKEVYESGNTEDLLHAVEEFKVSDYDQYNLEQMFNEIEEDTEYVVMNQTTEEDNDDYQIFKCDLINTEDDVEELDCKTITESKGDQENKITKEIKEKEEIKEIKEKKNKIKLKLNNNKKQSNQVPVTTQHQTEDTSPETGIQLPPSEQDLLSVIQRFRDWKESNTESEITLINFLKVIQTEDENVMKVQNLNQFSKQDGLIKFKNQIVIPEKYKYDIISMEHVLAAHNPINKLSDTIKEKYLMNDINGSCKSVVHSCFYCQINKHTNPTGNSHQINNHKSNTLPVPSLPMQTVGVDVQGPITIAGSDFDKDYIVTVTDLFSRYTYLELISKTDHMSIIKVLSNYLNNYTGCKNVISDNGVNLVQNEVVKAYLSSKNIKMFTIPPGCPFMNGWVERRHGFIKSSLTAMRMEFPKMEKVILVKEIQKSMNLYRNNVTALSPTEVIFGYDDTKRLSEAEYAEDYADDDVLVMSKAVEQIQQRHTGLIYKQLQEIRINLKDRWKQLMTDYNKQSTEKLDVRFKIVPDFEVGEIVLKSSVGNKYDHKYEVCKVVSKDSDHVYTVVDAKNNQYRRHVRCLKNLNLALSTIISGTYNKLKDELDKVPDLIDEDTISDHKVQRDNVKGDKVESFSVNCDRSFDSVIFDT